MEEFEIIHIDETDSTNRWMKAKAREAEALGFKPRSLRVQASNPKGSENTVCWADFQTLFEVRRAAGGLVVNGEGNYLFIRRQGKWDIPKGHIEPGEQSRECAVREVTEECGIGGLEIEKPICTTFHTYRLNGRPILKSTDWYLMRCNDSEKLTPQTEEDITEAVWVAPSDVDNRLKDSFSSIPEIFKQLKIENWK